MNDHSIAWMIGGGSRQDVPDTRHVQHLVAIREAAASRSAEARWGVPGRQLLGALGARFRPDAAPVPVALDCCGA
jgi:hypothetical protein